jgi:hypothetical protein
MAEKPDEQPTREDDVRRKYLEALQRKHSHASSSEGHLDGSPKTTAATNNTKHQRTFRRKSGG